MRLRERREFVINVLAVAQEEATLFGTDKYPAERRGRVVGVDVVDLVGIDVVEQAVEIVVVVPVVADALRICGQQIAVELVDRLVLGRAGEKLHLVAGGRFVDLAGPVAEARSEEHTSELQSLMRISYAVFCLNKKKNTQT